ncbi:SRPBCC family protein [Pseudonocardia lacus]|uniref:SRPBCC family protein n=1 Tax=Pseudonocardia lacus TaxID=2835865 RepID=UPI001BDC5A96|nr:SRPBCC family protein [Pseudonocardia lacus]
MKYADGPSVQVEVLVEAPVQRVWDLVTDIALPARFSAEFVGASWLDEGPRLAARFVGRNRHEAFGEWETTSTVSRFEPMRAFGWAVADPDAPSATWWFELDDGPDGVLLRQGTRMGPGRSGLNVAIDRMPDKEERIVARRLREHEANMRATVEGIKQLAEEGA